MKTDYSFITKLNLTPRLRFVYNYFGGLNSYIKYVDRFCKENNVNSLDYLQKIYGSPKDVIVLTPFNAFYNLADIDNNNILYSNSINFDSPYKVFSIDNKLLYTVSNHKGVFGNSSLDKHLINSSKSGAAYVLHFTNYKKESIVKYIVISHYSNSILTKEIVKRNVVSKTAEESIITINNRSTLFSSYSLLQAPPNNSMTYTDIVATSPSIEINNFSTANLSLKKEGYWLAINTRGQVERVTSPSDNNDLLYVVEVTSTYVLLYIGTGIDPTILNKRFGVSVNYSSSYINEILEIT